ncbi:MAG: LysM peptidoglycan-binding domain-containing protein [Litorilinea sp.]
MTIQVYNPHRHVQARFGMATLRRTLLALIAGVLLWAGFAATVQAATSQAATVAGNQCAQTHVVQRGENLYRIGLRYNVPLRTLQGWNQISNANRIFVGQRLCVQLRPATPPQPDAQPTDAELIEALRNVNIRRGPGLDHAVIGWMRTGTQARVTGISRNGQWWRILCPDDSESSCWVTALPYLTQAIPEPGHGPGGDGSDWDNSAAIVESIAVQVRESYPVQVVAVVRGYLPNSCTYIDRFRQLREGNTIRIQMTTGQNPGACAQVLMPFTQTITLDVHDWQTGLYRVALDNVGTDFYLP